MLTKIARLMILVIAVAPFAGLLAGCTGADNPKMADVPQIKPPDKPEPSPTPPGHSQPYGASKKYQDAMERQGRAAAGQ